MDALSPPAETTTPATVAGGGRRTVVMKPRRIKRRSPSPPKRRSPSPPKRRSPVRCPPRRRKAVAAPKKPCEWTRTSQTVVYKGETLKKWTNRVTGESAVRRAKVSADGTRKYIFRRV